MISNFKFVANGPDRGILCHSHFVTLLLRRKGIVFESLSQLVPISPYTQTMTLKVFGRLLMMANLYAEELSLLLMVF